MGIQTVVKLPGLARASDLTLALTRWLVGAFLMWETWDNVKSSERMAEFSAFLQSNGFPAPDVMAPLSVWAQFICGALLVLGLFTRWAAILMVFNFIVAFAMVHLDDPFRAQFPALILIAVNAHIAARGSGALGLDRLIDAPEAAADDHVRSR